MSGDGDGGRGPENEVGLVPTYVRMPDGSKRPVLGPDQPTNRRLVAIEELLEGVEDDARAARADTKDTTTAETLVARVERLEERVDAFHARLDGIEEWVVEEIKEDTSHE